MKRLVIIASFAVAALLVSACQSSGQGATSASAYPTKSSQGEISFALTPRLSNGHDLVVDVRANTHSGDLADLDLKALLALQVNGKTYPPTSAGELRGHHAKASVTFALAQQPKQFTIIIAAVRDMREQRLVWP